MMNGNVYLYYFAAIIIFITYAGNLHSGLHRDRSVRLFYGLLACDILMLLAGGTENLLLSAGLSGSGELKLLQTLISGISDFSYFSLLAVFILYLDCYGVSKGGFTPIAVLGAVISTVSGVLWFASDFFGIIYTQVGETIVMGPAYLPGQAGAYLTGLLTLLIYLKRRRSFRRSERISFALFILIPLLGSLIKTMVSGITIMPLLVTISIIIIQRFVQINRELLIREQQAEIGRIRTELLMSRLKPHFIYNVLNTIYALCDRSAEEAKEAIALFANYLRGNLVDIDANRLIPLETELEHVKDYLSIEKLRFGSRLDISYDIRTTDCMIPPLALLNVVENAVRHGIEKKPEGGQLRISTAPENGGCRITVQDSGPGFIPQKSYAAEVITDADGRKHAGLHSAAYRIAGLCRGSLEIDSAPGEGTLVTILLGGGGGIREDEAPDR